MSAPEQSAGKCTFDEVAEKSASPGTVTQQVKDGMSKGLHKAARSISTLLGASPGANSVDSENSPPQRPSTPGLFRRTARASESSKSIPSSLRKRLRLSGSVLPDHASPQSPIRVPRRTSSQNALSSPTRYSAEEPSSPSPAAKKSSQNTWYGSLKSPRKLQRARSSLFSPNPKSHIAEVYDAEEHRASSPILISGALAPTVDLNLEQRPLSAMMRVDPRFRMSSEDDGETKDGFVVGTPPRSPAPIDHVLPPTLTYSVTPESTPTAEEQIERASQKYDESPGDAETSIDLEKTEDQHPEMELPKEHTDSLEAYFEEDHWPSRKGIIRLSELLDLPCNQTKDWFVVRREQFVLEAEQWLQAYKSLASKEKTRQLHSSHPEAVAKTYKERGGCFEDPFQRNDTPMTSPSLSSLEDEGPSQAGAVFLKKGPGACPSGFPKHVNGAMVAMTETTQNEKRFPSPGALNRKPLGSSKSLNEYIRRVHMTEHDPRSRLSSELHDWPMIAQPSEALSAIRSAALPRNFKGKTPIRVSDFEQQSIDSGREPSASASGGKLLEQQREDPPLPKVTSPRFGVTSEEQVEEFIVDLTKWTVNFLISCHVCDGCFQNIRSKGELLRLLERQYPIPTQQHQDTLKCYDKLLDPSNEHHSRKGSENHLSSQKTSESGSATDGFEPLSRCPPRATSRADETERQSSNRKDKPEVPGISAMDELIASSAAFVTSDHGNELKSTQSFNTTGEREVASSWSIASTRGSSPSTESLDEMSTNRKNEQRTLKGKEPVRVDTLPGGCERISSIQDDVPISVRKVT